MQSVRQRVKELTPRSRCHADVRDVIADLNPLLRGWGNYFRTGNAARRFNQLDTYVWRRLHTLRVKRKGRHLHAGEADRWDLRLLPQPRTSPPARHRPLPGAALLETGDRVMHRPEQPPASRVREIRTHGLN